MSSRALRPSPISPTVDFSAEASSTASCGCPTAATIPPGVGDDPDHGHPNGKGPTALLTGGNHGDEYEGPIALFDLARTLKAGDVRARSSSCRR
jgi:N-alpha-acetyl-L-2,4-diaminobutyrate deacetylase